jgi:hypothetical protein
MHARRTLRRMGDVLAVLGTLVFVVLMLLMIKAMEHV